MADLDADFEAAVANSKKLSERPDNATLLKIYGLYKQATLGDVLARGMRVFGLRECASIRVLQEVAMPQGMTPATARLELDIAPAHPAIESVFAACGERGAITERAPSRSTSGRTD